MDAPLDAVHRVLLLHLHRVTQAEGPEEQILVLLQMRSTCSFHTRTLNRDRLQIKVDQQIKRNYCAYRVGGTYCSQMNLRAFLFLMLLLTTLLLM